jgi:hypothetical protein
VGQLRDSVHGLRTVYGVFLFILHHRKGLCLQGNKLTGEMKRYSDLSTTLIPKISEGWGGRIKKKAGFCFPRQKFKLCLLH